MDAALQGRLAALRMSEDCCQDLDALVAAARAAPLEAARRAFEALADPSRLMAAAMIKRHPGLCACEIQAGLGLSHATVSHHMRVLQEAGLIMAERRGKWVHYTATATAAPLVP